MNITFKSIGTIYSGFKSIENMPIQSRASSMPGRITLEPEYIEGLDGLSGFSHIIILYHFHLVTKSKLKVKPFLADEEKGIFAVRAPVRPNPIGMSIVKIQKIENNEIFLENIDVVDGTPLLDIKPYVPMFDSVPDAASGWLPKDVKLGDVQSDERFGE